MTNERVSTRTKHCGLLVSLGLFGLACAAPPGGIHYTAGKGMVTPDGLHRVDWEPFRITYVKPGADLQRYDKVLIEDVTVSYKTPPRPGHAADPSYALPDSAMKSLKRYFHEQFVQGLGASQNFTVANAAGPSVLRIAGHIVNLQISAPPLEDQLPNETVFTGSSGQMTLILDARDSQSGEPLVRVAAAKAIATADGGFYQSDPVSNSAAVRDMFRIWASDLRRELDQFHALPELPPLPAATPPQ